MTKYDLFEECKVDLNFDNHSMYFTILIDERKNHMVIIIGEEKSFDEFQNLS